MFLLLTEYVKRDQPITIDQELSVLQSGLIFSLQIDEPSVSDIQEVDFCEWAEAETSRRIETFGFCTVLIQSFLFTSLPSMLGNGRHFRFPCLPSTWEIGSPEEFAINHNAAFLKGDQLHLVFERLLEGTMPRMTDITPPTLYILAALLA